MTAACPSAFPTTTRLGSTAPSSTSTATRNLGFLLYLRSAGALAAGAPVRNPAPSTCTLLLTAGETASKLAGLLPPGLMSCCVQVLCSEDVLGSEEKVAMETRGAWGLRRGAK